MAVTDRQIHEAVRGGARTLKDLRRLLGVTSECGHCATYARQCQQEASASLRESPGESTREAQRESQRNSQHKIRR